MSDDPKRIGDYVIEQALGEGGMASVYQARHTILDSRHAIKVLDPVHRANPEVRQRFLDEGKIQASQLDHPNIVKVINVVATSEHAALVMELIEGPSLEAKLTELKDRPEEIRRIMFAVLDAVGYAHGRGIIHRDLKPANVLLASTRGQIIPKVTDFGIAKVLIGTTKKKSTHADTRMGTLGYSSPEQFRRAKDVTPRSDVFSLGAMLYEMATGEAAFKADSDYDLMDDIVNGRYEPPERIYAGIDPVIAAVIVKALQPDPANRFASCDEMAAALRAGDPPSSARGGSPGGLLDTDLALQEFGLDTAASVLAAAQEHQFAKRFAEAKYFYTLLIGAFPDTREARTAQLQLENLALLSDTKPDQGRSDRELILTAAQEHQLAWRFSEAKYFYTLLVRAFPDTREARTAQLQLENLAMFSATKPDQGHLNSELIEAVPGSTAKAVLLHAQGLHYSEDFDAARAQHGTLVEKWPDSDEAAMAKSQIENLRGATSVSASALADRGSPAVHGRRVHGMASLLAWLSLLMLAGLITIALVRELVLSLKD